MRIPRHTYQDPIEVIWLQAAAKMGMKVERSNEVFASWDGRGTLQIGISESLDADDCLAQMILHEVCHALVEGPASLENPDWGLQIDNPAHRVRENACLRLQAALTRQFGLQDILASTTTFRRYYDQLPQDPLADDGDPAVPPAVAGFERALHGPWSGILSDALKKTAQIAAIVHSVSPQDCLWTMYQTSASVGAD